MVFKRKKKKKKYAVNKNTQGWGGELVVKEAVPRAKEGGDIQIYKSKNVNERQNVRALVGKDYVFDMSAGTGAWSLPLLP